MEQTQACTPCCTILAGSRAPHLLHALGDARLLPLVQRAIAQVAAAKQAAAQGGSLFKQAVQQAATTNAGTHTNNKASAHWPTCCQSTAPASAPVVVKALLERGANGQVCAILQLQRLAQHVRAAVPEGLHDIGPEAQHISHCMVAARQSQTCNLRPPGKTGLTSTAHLAVMARAAAAAQQSSSLARAAVPP